MLRRLSHLSERGRSRDAQQHNQVFWPVHVCVFVFVCKCVRASVRVRHCQNCSVWRSVGDPMEGGEGRREENGGEQQQQQRWEGAQLSASGRSLIVDQGRGIVGVSLVHSPGHVVYIFCRKVEGLYLGVASLESAGRRTKGTLSHTSAQKWGHIADISIWMQSSCIRDVETGTDHTSASMRLT